MRTFKHSITDTAQTELYKIGTASEMIGVSRESLQWHCSQGNIDFSWYRTPKRTFIGFTDRQIYHAIFFFKARTDTKR